MLIPTPNFRLSNMAKNDYSRAERFNPLSGAWFMYKYFSVVRGPWHGNDNVEAVWDDDHVDILTL